ncbi:hypothetical protein ACTXT7_002552 [Hymenolepis weldensis]
MTSQRRAHTLRQEQFFVFFTHCLLTTKPFPSTVRLLGLSLHLAVFIHQLHLLLAAWLSPLSVKKGLSPHADEAELSFGTEREICLLSGWRA